LRDLGIYALGAQLARGFISFCGALNLALQPWLYRQLGNLDGPDAIRTLVFKIAYIVTFLCIAALLFYLALSLAVPIYFTPRYQLALVYFPWLMAAGLCEALYAIVSGPQIFHLRKTILSLSGIFNLLCTAVLVAILARNDGPVGAAMGMFFGRLIQLVLGTVMTGYTLIVNETARNSMPISDTLK